MRTLLPMVSLCWLVLSASLAQAQSALETCLVVLAPGPDAADFEALVRTEILRHRTYHVASGNCTVELTVERVRVDDEVFLTARLASDVPHRVRVERGRYDLALSALLRVVLGQAPLTLQDPGAADRRMRTMLGLTRTTGGLFGLSLSENFVFLPGSTMKSLPGVSLSYQRELDVFQVGLRADSSFWLSGSDPELHPTFFLTVIPELSVFSSRRANTAGFMSIGLGLVHQRFRGPVSSDPKQLRTTFQTGPVGALRLGVECLRSAEVRLRFFVEAMLPVFRAHDAQHEVIDGWVPSLSIGSGLAI